MLVAFSFTRARRSAGRPSLLVAPGGGILKDQFGAAVALSLDGSVFAASANGVGVPAGTGAVYTGPCSAAGCKVVTSLIGAPNEFLGSSLSFSRDGTFMAAGTNQIESNGVVYTYLCSGGACVAGATIPAPVAYKDFGRAVSLAPDGNGLAVGATGGSGAVYMYDCFNATATGGVCSEPQSVSSTPSTNAQVYGFAVRLAAGSAIAVSAPEWNGGHGAAFFGNAPARLIPITPMQYADLAGLQLLAPLPGGHSPPLPWARSPLGAPFKVVDATLPPYSYPGAMQLFQCQWNPLDGTLPAYGFGTNISCSTNLAWTWARTIGYISPVAQEPLTTSLWLCNTTNAVNPAYPSYHGFVPGLNGSCPEATELVMELGFVHATYGGQY